MTRPPGSTFVRTCFAVAAVSVSVLCMSSCSTTPTASTPANAPKTAPANHPIPTGPAAPDLGLLSASSGSFDAASQRFTLSGVDAQATWFTDRPSHEFGHDSTLAFLESFFPSPSTPPVDVQVTGPSSQSTAYTFSNPSYSPLDATLSFKAVPVTSPAPASSSPTFSSSLPLSVFFDRALHPTTDAHPQVSAAVDASNGSWSPATGVLTLTGVSSPALFSSAPRRSLVYASFDDMTKLMFASSPNAVLVTSVEGQPVQATFELSNPTFDPVTRTASFSARGLVPSSKSTSSSSTRAAVALPDSRFGPAALMIDDGSCPYRNTGPLSPFCNLNDTNPAYGQQNNPTYNGSMSTNPAYTRSYLTIQGDRSCGVNIDMSGLLNPGSPGVNVTLNKPDHGEIYNFNNGFTDNAGGKTGTMASQTISAPYGTNLFDTTGLFGWAGVQSNGALTGCQGSIDITDMNNNAPIAHLTFSNPYDGADSSGCQATGMFSCGATPTSGDQTIFYYQVFTDFSVSSSVGNNGWVVGHAGWWNNTASQLAPSTAPAVAALPGGAFVYAYVGSDGGPYVTAYTPAQVEYNAGPFAQGNVSTSGSWSPGTTAGVASGTTMAVTAAASSPGGWEAAWTGNDGNLWVADASGPTKLTGANGVPAPSSSSSPSVIGLSGGGFLVGFVDSSNNAWTAGAASTNLGLTGGQPVSPSSGVALAPLANNWYVWAYPGTDNVVHAGTATLGNPKWSSFTLTTPTPVAPGTNLSFAVSPDQPASLSAKNPPGTPAYGNWWLGFQATDGSLQVADSVSLAPSRVSGSSGLPLQASHTSPSLVFTKGTWLAAFVGADNNLWTAGSYVHNWGGVGAASPSATS